jgi:3-isopropylmalate/(R)-2-methylmalate dehydratase small subunit
MKNEITVVAGSAMYFPGKNIDTDTIIPKDFLKTTKAYGFEDAAFAYEREDARKAGKVHPFDDPNNKGSSILITDTNFACGSSREHAVWCLRDWGIKAVISCAESEGSPGFADIFRGNATANGMPCVELTPEDHEALLLNLRSDDKRGLNLVLNIDLQKMQIEFIDPTKARPPLPCQMPADHRESLIKGGWDQIQVLLSAGDAIEKTAETVPYLMSEPV